MLSKPTRELSSYANLSRFEAVFLPLLSDLIAKPSVTPYDAGCQDILLAKLQHLGFQIQKFHHEGADSFWATHGEGKPLVVLVGHTDVVPVGQENAWLTPPFTLTRQGDELFGRGVADMKGSLVCMLAAISDYLEANPNHPGTLALLITSAEEGPSMHGTPVVLEAVAKQGISIDHVIVGEPTAISKVGDVIKHGRRGSLTGELTIHGKQGHIAYPDLADNPIHRAFAALQALSQKHWDKGNEAFEPSSLQFSNIHAGTGAGNVIPGELKAMFNIRYSPESQADKLMQEVIQILDSYGIAYDLTWVHYGKPYLTPVVCPLIDKIKQAILAVTGMSPTLSTSGGTSDARYFADYTKSIVELGPVSRTIHQTNECVNINDLRQFYLILCQLLPMLLNEENEYAY